MSPPFVTNFFLGKYRYEEKRWIGKNTPKSRAKSGEMNRNVNVVEVGSDSPRKARSLSLEEEILTKHATRTATPITKSRGVIFNIVQ